MEQAIETLTDLELIDLYIEKCRQFVNPRLFGHCNSRGLIPYLNYLPTNVDEAKSVVRARLSKANKYFGDDEIDKIAGEVDRLETLRKELNKLNLADAHKVIEILNKMQTHSQYVLNYFK